MEKRTNPNKKYHGWDKQCGIYHCSDGEHNSFWISIIQTEEWKLWEKHAWKNKLYDVDECRECGWASVEHIKDFLKFVRKLKV